MSLTPLTPPAALPLHIADVRQHLRQDITDDDNLIIGVYAPAAVAEAESATQRQLVAARYRYTIDSFPAVIKLPKSPLIQIIGINYIAADGTTQTVPSENYTIDPSSLVPEITLMPGKSWPIISRQANAVQITFDAGYVAPFAVDIPANSIAAPAWKPLVVGETVRLSNSGGALPVPLENKKDYFVQAVILPGTYTLSATSGGPAIDLTSVGTGLNFIGQTGINGSDGEIPAAIIAWILLNVETQYTYRGRLLTTADQLSKNPFVDRLLDPYRTVLL